MSRQAHQSRVQEKVGTIVRSTSGLCRDGKISVDVCSLFCYRYVLSAGRLPAKDRAVD